MARPHVARPRVALALALALACAACSSGSATSVKNDAASATGPQYVALGDSYTAGPDLAQTDGNSATCNRSLRNYPRLVSKKIDASLTDVSCSGATTDNVLNSAQIGGVGPAIPAQIDSVKASTTLVTVGIGGNDDGLFSSLSSACTEQGTACADYLSDRLPTVLRATRARVAAVLDAVEAKAPKADVILVGYLGVAPPDKGCEALGGGALDTRGVSEGERSIDAMMSAAAKLAAVTYVSMRVPSAGHDACAGSAAWTNGIAPQSLGDGASLHPREAGMVAAATSVESAITPTS